MNKQTAHAAIMAFVATLTAASSGTANAESRVYIDVAPGKACWVEAYTNSAAVWTMKITNGEGIGVVMSGSGINFKPMDVVSGNARFDVKGAVVAEFSSNIGKADVKSKHHTILNSKNDPAAFNTFIGGEDATDDDWQDIIANVTCLHHAG